MTIQEIPPDQTPLLLPLLHQVHDLHLGSQPQRYRPLPDEAELITYLRSWLAQPGLCALGYFEGDDLLGYAIYGLEERPATPFHPAEMRMMLHQISVDETQRLRGIGLALLQETRSRLKQAGANVLVATVASFNTPSAALMARAGLHPACHLMEWRAGNLQ